MSYSIFMGISNSRDIFHNKYNEAPRGGFELIITRGRSRLRNPEQQATPAENGVREWFMLFN